MDRAAPAEPLSLAPDASGPAEPAGAVPGVAELESSSATSMLPAVDVAASPSKSVSKDCIEDGQSAGEKDVGNEEVPAGDYAGEDAEDGGDGGEEGKGGDGGDDGGEGGGEDNENSEADPHASPPPASSASSAEATPFPAASAEDAGPPPPTPVATDLPCMRGSLVVDAAGGHVVSGQWGMTVSAHGVEGQTSPFELRLPPPRPGLPPHAPRTSGLYSGFFMLMQTAGKPALKVDEKQVNLTLVANSSGGHNVHGKGRNRFGQFTVTGTIAEDGVAELFRAYVPKAAPAPKESRKRQNLAKVGQAAQRPCTAGAAAPAAGYPPTGALAASGSPRGLGGLGGKTIQGLAQVDAASEGQTTGGRSKRATAGDWKDKADIPMNREPSAERLSGVQRKGKGKEHAPAGAPGAGGDLPALPSDGVDLPSSLSDGSQSFAGRVRKLPAHLQDGPEEKLVRLNEHMRKCLAVLRDVTKLPSSHWFLAPVDWRALNLLDYPSVVKRPMDLGTAKLHVETGQVTTPDEFKDMVLLVFRNALAYNTKRDNLVHIAALELKAVFEEKYHTVIEPLGPIKDKETEAAEKVAAAAAAAPRGRKPGAAGKGAPPRVRAKPGPRDEATAGAAPRKGGGGGGAGGMVPQARFMALQQQMEMMQKQLSELKRQTSDTELNMKTQLEMGTLGGGGATAAAPRNRGANDDKPLTEAAKNALKEGISNLAPDKINRVLEIIKERMSSVGNDASDDVEVDLDLLDARTLHQLERYVKTCAPRKRKANGGGGNSGGASGHGGFYASTPGLSDLDMDMHALEDDVLDAGDLDAGVGPSKRGRPSSLGFPEALDGLPFSQSDLPDGLGDEDDN